MAVWNPDVKVNVVVKIKIAVGAKEIELTPDELDQLRRVLAPQKEYVPYYPTWPAYPLWWPNPVYVPSVFTNTAGLPEPTVTITSSACTCGGTNG